MTGAWWAIAAGIGFGLFQTVNRRAVRGMDIYMATFLQLLIGGLVLAAVSLATENLALLGRVSAWAWLNFSLAGRNKVVMPEGQPLSPDRLASIILEVDLARHGLPARIDDSDHYTRLAAEGQSKADKKLCYRCYFHGYHSERLVFGKAGFASIQSRQLC